MYTNLYNQNKLNKLITIQKICSAQDIHPAGCSRRESGNTGARPFSFTISVMGYFTCITQYMGPGPTALRTIRRTKQLWLSVLPKDTSAVTGQAGIRTHILTTPVQCTRLLGHDTPHCWHVEKISNTFVPLYKTSGSRGGISISFRFAMKLHWCHLTSAYVSLYVMYFTAPPLISRGRNLVSCGRNLLSCGRNLLSRGRNLLSCGRHLIILRPQLIISRPQLIISRPQLSISRPQLIISRPQLNYLAAAT